MSLFSARQHISQCSRGFTGLLHFRQVLCLWLDGAWYCIAVVFIAEGDGGGKRQRLAMCPLSLRISDFPCFLLPTSPPNVTGRWLYRSGSCASPCMCEVGKPTAFTVSAIGSIWGREGSFPTWKLQRSVSVLRFGGGHWCYCCYNWRCCYFYFSPRQYPEPHNAPEIESKFLAWLLTSNTSSFLPLLMRVLWTLSSM